MSIAHLLTNQVWFAPIKERTAGGDPVLGPLQCIPARVERRSELVIDEDGNQVQSNNVVASEIELPSGAFTWFDRAPAIKLDKNCAVRRIRSDFAETPSGYGFFDTRF